MSIFNYCTVYWWQTLPAVLSQWGMNTLFPTSSSISLCSPFFLINQSFLFITPSGIFLGIFNHPLIILIKQIYYILFMCCMKLCFIYKKTLSPHHPKPVFTLLETILPPRRMMPSVGFEVRDVSDYGKI